MSHFKNLGGIKDSSKFSTSSSCDSLPELPLATPSLKQILNYSVYYMQVDKKNAKVYREGVLTLDKDLIKLADSNGKILLEAKNSENIKEIVLGREYLFGTFEVEVDKLIIEPILPSNDSAIPNKKPSPDIRFPLNKESAISTNKPSSDYKIPAINDSVGLIRAIDDIIPEDSIVIDNEYKVFIEPFLAKKLKPHQVEAIQFMYDCLSGRRMKKYFGCILADSMGLGKTLSALALYYTLLKHPPPSLTSLSKCIVICPATLINNWAAEIQKWLQTRVTYLKVTGTSKQKSIDNFLKLHSGILLISYESFALSTAKLKSCGLLICDEAHKIKNRNTKQYIAIDNITCNHRIILTGTPLQNYINEFFNCVDLVNKNILGEWKSFRSFYAKVIIDSQEPDAADWKIELAKERSQELWQITKNFMLRRTGKILFETLPQKHEYLLFFEPTSLQEKVYLTFLRSQIADDAISDGDLTEALGLITMLKKVANHPDLVFFKEPNSEKLLKDWNSAIKHFPEGYAEVSDRSEHSLKLIFVLEMTRICLNNREKLVIVSNYTSVLSIIEQCLRERLYDFYRLDGKTSLNARQRIVDAFNNNPKTVVLLLSSKAGGCGLNLIGGSRLIMYDPDWNPKNDQQAMARIWREGQEKEVHIYRLVLQGTIEEKIYQRQTCKESLANHVIDARISSNKFSHDFIKQIFKFCKTSESFQRSDQPKDLKNSWLDRVKVDIQLIKKIPSEWEENQIKDEKTIMENPKSQGLESVSEAEVGNTGKKSRLSIS